MKNNRSGVNILGTMYALQYGLDDPDRLGFVDYQDKVIHMANMPDDASQLKLLLHEVIHAYSLDLGFNPSESVIDCIAALGAEFLTRNKMI